MAGVLRNQNAFVNVFAHHINCCLQVFSARRIGLCHLNLIFCAEVFEAAEGEFNSLHF